jgi:hypothetical protein
METYGSALKVHIEPAFALRPVTEITKDDIKTFLMQKKEQGASNSVLGRFKALLSSPKTSVIRDGDMIAA